MEVLIRPWNKEDFAQVRRILWESWISAYSSFIPAEDLRAYLDATYRIESLARLYESPFVHGFIAEADGEVAGWARTQFHKSENRLFLASLYLLPAFQGKGIGGKLIRVAEEKAFVYGLRELWVGVMVQNVAARRWYEKWGFHFVKEEPFRMARATVPHLIGFKALDAPAQDWPLEGRLAATFTGTTKLPALDEIVARLLAGQQQTWAGLGEGYAALAEARVREVRGERWRVMIQFNPRRMASSSARIDPASPPKRPCFLCLGNLPPDQKAILYRDAYLILCNPAPIFPGHLTIAGCLHRPQSFAEHQELFLRLAQDFGPRMIVFYNGPFCGASAPDHLHFQAAPAGILPVEREVQAATNRGRVRTFDGTVLRATAGLGRGIIVIGGEDAAGVGAVLGKVIGALHSQDQPGGEPLMNLIGTHTGRTWRVIVFPRRKHRPDAYFREGAERILVSPGAVDMGGLIVTPREEDFRVLDRELIQGIFREVACDDAAVDTLLKDL
jgi:ribosomal protein S18 acetylase RimI-like enzyme